MNKPQEQGETIRIQGEPGRALNSSTPSPTFSEHHSLVCWEAGGQRLNAQVFSALPQVLPLQRPLASQPPEVGSVARSSFMRALDAGHLLRSDGENGNTPQLLVFADADRQPVAELSVVEGVHHLEDVPPAEGQALRSLFLVLKSHMLKGANVLIA
ncbi:hypothetical protein EYF80_022090 [Liparis tanakae]|uniref:Uncharacterized protein n=1 Tax=Liparis tanakae TaxID=230148 RepID=A0A4Z2HP51_9TELE|nr:hypothetical protein EYF80_022090 [Liparis tanakae]